MKDDGLRDLRRRVLETKAEDSHAVYALAKALERIGQFEDEYLVPRSSTWIETRSPWREVLAYGVVRVKRKIDGEERLVARVKFRVARTNRRRDSSSRESGQRVNDRRRLFLPVDRFLVRFVKLVVARPTSLDTPCGACGAGIQTPKLCACGYALCSVCFLLESHVGHRDLERQRTQP